MTKQSNSNHYSWKQIEEHKDSWLVIDNKVYDVSTFAGKHPGGKEIITKYLGKDASDAFFCRSASRRKGHLHSKVAMKWLESLKVGELVPEERMEETIHTAAPVASSNEDGSSSSYVIGFSRNNNNNDNDMNASGNGDKINHNHLNNRRSSNNDCSDINNKKEKQMEESEEDLMRKKVAIRHKEKYGVDINKPLVYQAFNLAPETYLEWIDDPIPGTARLFGPDWMEVGTRTNWRTIPMIWTPIILFGLILAVKIPISNLTPLSFCLSFLAGELAWALFEYCLHRFIFHWKPRPIYLFGYIPLPIPVRFQQLLHFLLHGIHHILPTDGDRLVAPPSLSISVALVFLFLPIVFPLILLMYSISPAFLYFILPSMLVLLSGFGAGYMSYDLIHYYLHHGEPNLKYFKYLKSAHNSHHYDEHDKHFGVSNPLFDFLLNTA